MKRLIVLLIFTLLLAGCRNNLSPHAVIAKQYLADAGYKVISYEGNSNYALTKEMLTQMPYMSDWGKQKIDPSEFIGSTVEIEKFIVSNHPLDHWTSGNLKSKGKTAVSVWVTDTQVIGGTSFPIPDSKELLVGGNYSLDGKTLEEIQSMDFKTWLEKWQMKFEMQNLIGKPPFPTITIGDKHVTVVRGSSCWSYEDSSSCVEKAPPRDLLKDVVPTITTSHSKLTIGFQNKPTDISVNIWTEKEPTSVNMDGTTITLPVENGIYFYVVSAQWKEGSSEFVFSIEISDKA
jgi:hypothetical protein